MSISAKAIQAKIGSVKNIKKITKAMELVSVSKMQKAVAAVLGTRVYALRGLEVLANISTNQFLRHPFLREGNGDKDLVIVVSSNKGLCGAFNVSIRRMLIKLLTKNNNRYDVIAVGKYSERSARAAGANIAASFVDIPETIRVEDISGITQFVREEFEKGTYRRVYVIYTLYESALVQRPNIRRLLPISEDITRDMIDEIVHMEEDLPEIEEEKMSQYIFEPQEDEVVDAVLPRLMEVVLYQALLESRASEHSARMMAMKNASENAEEMVDTLTLSYNKARQSTVTREILEIATGAEALG